MSNSGDMIVNNLLCFINSAKANHTDESLFEIVNSFYSHEEIKQAKTELSNILKTDLIWRRDPDKKGKDLKDVLEFFGTFKASNQKIKFVADTYKKMPPLGMELIAPILVNLAEEVARINELLPKILDVKTEVLNSADIVRQMRIDISEIKTNFNQAVNGLKEVSSDIAENDISILEDLRSFRQSMSAATSEGMNAAASEVPQTYASALQFTSGMDSPKPTDNNKHSSARRELVTRRSTGAVTKTTAINKSPPKPQRQHKHPYPPIQDQARGSEAPRKSSTTDDENGDVWSVAGERERQKRERRRQLRKESERKKATFRVLGSRKSGNQLKAVKRTADVFIGRLENNISIENIKEYVIDNFEIEIYNIEQLIIKTDLYKAFKVTVAIDDREKLFNAELWPEDIIVDKFYNRSHRHSS